MRKLASVTILEFDQSDFEPAQSLCARLGYGQSFAYGTSSAIPGLYCLPLRPSQPTVVICKTAEFGLIAIQTFDN